MNHLEKSKWGKSKVSLREVKIKEGQSKYAHLLKQIWDEGINAYMNMKLREPNAANQAQKALKKSIRYEVTEVSLLLLIRLLNYYPYRGLKKETEKIQEKVKEYQVLMNIETDLDYYVTDVDKELVNKLSSEKGMNKLNEYLEIIDPILYKYHSLNFLTRAYGLKMRKARLEKNRVEILAISKEALSRFHKKDFELPHIVYILFQFPLIGLHMESNEFDKAEKVIQDLYQRLNKKSVNWFAIHSYHILLNFKKLDFEKVKELLQLVKSNDNLINRERNKIYGAYISLFTSYKFPLGQFNGELLEHSKDKDGHRISIIIVHLLHLLKYKRYGEFIDRVEGVKKYLQRYLKSKSPKFIRSRSLLNCLVLTAHKRVNFNKIAWKRKTEFYLEKIQSNPASESTILEHEVINFEFLYFYVEGLLK